MGRFAEEKPNGIFEQTNPDSYRYNTKKLTVYEFRFTCSRCRQKSSLVGSKGNHPRKVCKKCVEKQNDQSNQIT